MWFVWRLSKTPGAALEWWTNAPASGAQWSTNQDLAWEFGACRRASDFVYDLRRSAAADAYTFGVQSY